MSGFKLIKEIMKCIAVGLTKWHRESRCLALLCISVVRNSRLL